MGSSPHLELIFSADAQVKAREILHAVFIPAHIALETF
jgi:hypothetical protein